MFMGEYQHSIDAKGRIFIPSRLREGLGDTFILTKGLDGCLFAYPDQEWQALEQKLKSLPFTRRDARAFARLFFSGATECEVDKQGRVLIPANLREHSKMGKDAIIIGVSTRVEIWSAEVWENYKTDATSSYEDIAEKTIDVDMDL